MNREEQAFWDHCRSFGKACFIHRFEDNAEINGKNFHNIRQGRLISNEQPADFLVTLDGQTFFAEIKGTINAKGISTGLFKDVQLNTAQKQEAAGGVYWFFIFSHTMQKWYRLKREDVTCARKWTELSPYIVNIKLPGA